MNLAIVERLFSAHGLPDPVPELRFHATRKWRFDFAWPECKLAIEIDGGAWTKGRHTRGRGFVADMEKLNAATVLGWRVLRFTPAQMKSGAAFQVIREAMGALSSLDVPLTRSKA